MAAAPPRGLPSVALVSAFGIDALGAGAARLRRLQASLAAAGFPCRHLPLPHQRGALPSVRLPLRIARLGWRLGLEGDVRPAVAAWALPRLACIADDVALVSVPPFSLLPAAALAVPSRVRLVVDYRDAWCARVAPPAAARLARPLERWSGRRIAAACFAGHPRLGELLTGMLQLPPERIVWVPNGVPRCELPTPLPAPPPGRRPLRLLLPGYLYGLHDPAELAAALDAVGPTVATLEVLGHQPSYVRRALSDLPGVRLRRPVPHAELLKEIARADAVVSILPATSPTETRVPAKLYDSLAVGTPVLLLAPPGAAALSVPHGGRIHHCQDAQALASLLRAAARDRRRLGPRTPVDVDPHPGMRRLAELLCSL